MAYENDPRAAVVRGLLEHMAGLFVDLEDGLHSDILGLDWRVPAMLDRIDAADQLRGPIEQLKDKHPVVLYFDTREDAEGFAAVVGECFSSPVTIRL